MNLIIFCFVRPQQRSKLFVLQKKEETSLFNLWMILFAALRVILLQVVVRAFAASTPSALLHPYLGSIHSH